MAERIIPGRARQGRCCRLLVLGKLASLHEKECTMFRIFKISIRLMLENVNFRFREITRRYVRKIVEIIVTDFDLTAALDDLGAAAAFERAHLLDAAYFKARHQLYEYVLSKVAEENDGLFLEFGVYKGDSINRLAGLTPNRSWFGFDSFTGLPEAWTPGARKGAFDVKGTLPPVRKNVTLIRGFFEKSLPSFVAQHQNEQVAFLHIDCDLYSATRTVLNMLGNMLRPGCIIVFDEYFNYPDWKNGEYKAFAEYIAKSGRSFEYVAYVRNGTQVAVRLA
jgi:hypothetical protein